MSVKIPELLCAIKMEEYRHSSDANVTKRVAVSDGVISLVRNGCEQICVRITRQNTGQQLKQLVINGDKSFKLNAKFANEGKACLTLLDHNLRVFVSNCAPNELCLFLKCFAIKTLNNNKENAVNVNHVRSQSTRRTLFEQISPVTGRDINERIAGLKRTLSVNESPKSSKTEPLVKRKCSNNEVTKCRNDTNTSRAVMINALFPSPVRHMKVLDVNKLNGEQSRVMSAVLSGRNIFFTGSAGTGKSYLLKYIIKRLPPESTFVTASTGIAASHIAGMTLHLFSGVGSELAGRQSVDECARKLMSNEAKLAKWKKCKCLIVDEISMISGQYFNFVESVARVVRGNEKPFGGIQIVLCGDFLQLPPISKHNAAKDYCFQTQAWTKCVDYSFELTQVRRQTDQNFINILQSLRVGECNDFVRNALINTAGNSLKVNGFTATRLYTHRNDVDVLNGKELNAIAAKSCYYEPQDCESKFSFILDSICPTNKRLELKIGAQVMINKNIDVSRGLVNGSCGQVIAFEKHGSVDYPVVRFVNGCQTVITPERWTIKVSDKCVTRRHLPLQLAWALSIHKSQGMTIDFIEISLARVFECGQTYVALSRAKSLDTIKVIDFNANSVIVDSNALQFYRNLKYA